MKYPQNTWKWQGKKVLSIRIRTDDIKNYQPIEQVYGIVFNYKGEVLIARRGTDNWNLPGGHPEKGETVEETLKRELLEEVDTTIHNIKALGIQASKVVDRPNTKFEYQLRCIAELDKLLPQTPDLASGDIWKQKFVPANKVSNYVKWGEVGKAMFKDAVDLYQSTSSSK